MRPRKQFGLLYLVLLLITTASGLLIWSHPTEGSDPEPGNTPRALLQIVANPPMMLSTTNDSPEDYERYLQTQAALIKSRLVINHALQRPAIAQLPAIKNQADPFGWLQQNLDVINVKKSELVQVSLSPRSGASSKDRAAIIDAVVSAYMQEVVGAELKRRADRHSILRKTKEKYAELILQRRETARKLAESVGNGGRLSSAEQKSLVRRHDKLLEQRLELRLGRAEAETLVERRTKALNREKAANRDGGSVRNELAQLEDRLAIIAAHERVLQDELNQVASERRSDAAGSLELKTINEELVLMEDVARKVGTELERLNVELDAPRASG